MDLKIIALLTPDGFDRKFWDNASKTKTYKEAYEQTEQEYQKYFLKRKYSDYNSYRNCRDKRIKKATKLHKKK
tara:strand:+ start:504 stop:722 length:219 start_codon:yes stop_codon:yes gene_type:complete